MRFLVPQFIDVEPKVFGPITVRQFLIMIVGAMTMFITYKMTDFSLFIFMGLIELMTFGTVAFMKINGQPFHYFVLNFVQTVRKPAVRIWKKEEIKVKEKKEKEKIEEKKKEIIPRRELPPSRLSELTMVVNTGGVYKEEEE